MGKLLFLKKQTNKPNSTLLDLMHGRIHLCWRSPSPSPNEMSLKERLLSCFFLVGKRFRDVSGIQSVPIKMQLQGLTVLQISHLSAGLVNLFTNLCMLRFALPLSLYTHTFLDLVIFVFLHPLLNQVSKMLKNQKMSYTRSDHSSVVCTAWQHLSSVSDRSIFT